MAFVFNVTPEALGALADALGKGGSGSSSGGAGPVFMPQLVVPQVLTSQGLVAGGSFPIYGPMWPEQPEEPVKPPPWVPPPALPPAPPVPPPALPVPPPALPLPPAPLGPVASVAGEGKHVKHFLMLITTHPANYAKLVALNRMRDFMVK